MKRKRGLPRDCRGTCKDGSRCETPTRFELRHWTDPDVIALCATHLDNGLMFVEGQTAGWKIFDRRPLRQKAG